MKRILISTIALAAATSFSYSQQQQQQLQNAQQEQNQASRERTSGAAANQQQEQMGPEHVQKCIREKASDNQFEIQAGQLVEQRSQDPQVKQFAQRLVRDHQQAEQQLQQVAQQAGQQAGQRTGEQAGQQAGQAGQRTGQQAGTGEQAGQRAGEQLGQQASGQIGQGTQQMNQVHQAKLQELQQKQGQELDRAFIFDQVAGHEKDVLMSQWESQHEQNAQLKQYAQQQLPTLQEHLRMARQIAEQWVPQARQASETIRGNSDQNPGAPRGTIGK